MDGMVMTDFSHTETHDCDEKNCIVPTNEDDCTHCQTESGES